MHIYFQFYGFSVIGLSSQVSVNFLFCRSLFDFCRYLKESTLLMKMLE